MAVVKLLQFSWQKRLLFLLTELSRWLLRAWCSLGASVRKLLDWQLASPSLE
jgi:hypothetical protein